MHLASSVPRFSVSRRAFLVAGVSGLLALDTARTAGTTLPAFGSFAAVEPKGSPQLFARCFDADFASRYEVGFPAVVSAAAGESAASNRLVIEWDPRLFHVNESVSGVQGSRITSLGGVFEGPGRLVVDVPGGYDWLYPRVSRMELYPFDGLPDPRPTRITFAGRTSTGDLTRFPSQPWGLEVGANWRVAKGYSYPDFVEMRSTGPYPVPADVDLMVRVYEDVPPLAVTGPATDLDQRRVKRVTEYTFAAERAVEAGESIVIEMEPLDGATDREGVPSLAQNAYVEALVPEHARLDARLTRRYTVAPLTPSGSALTDGRAVRKA